MAYLQNDKEFGRAEYMFGTVNVLEDIEELDRYIKDHLWHVYTAKRRSGSNYRKVPNNMLRSCGYISMAHLFKLYRTFPWQQSTYSTVDQPVNFTLKPLYEVTDEAYTRYFSRKERP